MKTDLKLWKEYTEELEKATAKTIEWKKNWVLSTIKKNNERFDEYFRKNKEVHEKHEKAHKEWESIPWIIRGFYPEPELNWLDLPRVPYVGIIPPIDCSIKPTYEDFLNWCVKKGNL